MQRINLLIVISFVMCSCGQSVDGLYKSFSKVDKKNIKEDLHLNDVVALTDEVVLLSSHSSNTVYQLDFTNNQLEEYLVSPNFTNTQGMLCDTNFLYVLNTSSSFIDELNGVPVTSELLVFDSQTKALLNKIDLNRSLEVTSFYGNGLAQDQHGFLYITDSVNGYVVKLNPENSAAEILVKDLRLKTKGASLTGVTYYTAGTLFVAHSDKGELFKVDVSQKEPKIYLVYTSESLIGIYVQLLATGYTHFPSVLLSGPKFTYVPFQQFLSYKGKLYMK